MKVQDLIAVRGRQKQLELQREKKIKYRLLNKQRQQLADSDQRKINKQKTKRIEKKKIENVREKVVKERVPLENNVTVETFLNQSSDYKKYLERTKNTLGFSGQELLKSVQMLKTVCAQNRKNSPLLSVEIKFDGSLNPPVRPFQMQLPHNRRIKNVILIAEDLTRLKENIKDWKHRYNLHLLTLREFRTNFKDSQFHSKVMNSNTLIFCDFRDFQQLCDAPIYEQIAFKNAVFPIQTRRLCRSIQNQFNSYTQFLDDLCQYGYFLIRPGQQYTVHVGDLNLLSPEENTENVMEGVWSVIARLLYKNKTKGAKVVNVSLRTTFSIPVEIYHAE